MQRETHLNVSLEVLGVGTANDRETIGNCLPDPCHCNYTKSSEFALLIAQQTRLDSLLAGLTSAASSLATSERASEILISCSVGGAPARHLSLFLSSSGDLNLP